MCKRQVEKDFVNVCWAELAVMGRNTNKETLMVKLIELLNTFQKERLGVTLPGMQ